MRPGETNTLKKTIVFKIFNIDGLPCSGEAGEGNVFAPIAGEVQLNRDFGGYVNVVDHTDLVHVGDGDYRFMFDDTEVTGTEGWILLRVKRNTGPLVSQIRTQTVLVPLRYDSDDVLALLHHNAVVDNQTYSGTDLTAFRVRQFASPVAAAAAVTGAANGADGEVMRFQGTITYASPGKPSRFQLVRQL